jgi:VanZ family protein
MKRYQTEVKERALMAVPDEVRQAYEGAKAAFNPALVDYNEAILSSWTSVAMKAAINNYPIDLKA